MKATKTILKILIGVAVPLFILTFAIAVPILCRPYYYANIKWLNLEEETGFTYQQIKTAYDDVMDYLVCGKEFKTGDLRYSQEGKQHFADCKKLFVLDFVVLGVTAAFLATLFILRKVKKIDLDYKKRTPAFWGVSTMLGLFAALGIYGAIDFDGFFTLFHKVFFAGKDNWVFDSYSDQIIDILPQRLWANFAILIVVIVVLLVVGVYVLEYVRRRKLKANDNPQKE